MPVKMTALSFLITGLRFRAQRVSAYFCKILNTFQTADDAPSNAVMVFDSAAQNFTAAWPSVWWRGVRMDCGLVKISFRRSCGQRVGFG